MSHVTAMLDAYPKDLGNIDRQKLADCIHACFACGETCTACADACLSEDMVAELTKCIRTNLDCADICTQPARCCPGTPATTPTSPEPCWRPAVSPAQAAPQNAKPTPACMSTAASAPKQPAAGASRPAPTCWAVSADASGARGTAGGRSFGVTAATTMTDAVVGFREGVGSARAFSDRDVRLGRSSPVCVPPLTRLVPPQSAGTPLARPSALRPHLPGPGPPWRGMRSAPRC